MATTRRRFQSEGLEVGVTPGHLSPVTTLGLRPRAKSDFRPSSNKCVQLTSLEPLAAAICSRDVGKVHGMAKMLQAGAVWANCTFVTDPSLPIAGHKQSGWGAELGREGLDPYLATKAIYVRLGDCETRRPFLPRAQIRRRSSNQADLFERDLFAFHAGKGGRRVGSGRSSSGKG